MRCGGNGGARLPPLPTAGPESLRESSCAEVWPARPVSAMPPKKQAQAGGSKKAEQKKKEKIIEVST